MNKKTITMEQIRELSDGDYVWLTFKLLGPRPFKSQESMDKVVSKYCNVKHLKEFLSAFNVEIESNEIDALWEKVKETVSNHNK